MYLRGGVVEEGVDYVITSDSIPRGNLVNHSGEDDERQMVMIFKIIEDLGDISHIYNTYMYLLNLLIGHLKSFEFNEGQMVMMKGKWWMLMIFREELEKF